MAEYDRDDAQHVKEGHHLDEQKGITEKIKDKLHGGGHDQTTATGGGGFGGDHAHHVNEGHHIEEHGSNPPAQHLTSGTTARTGPGHNVRTNTGDNILNRSGSGSSSSSEDDGEGGRRKKKGMMGKIKDKLPGGGHGVEDHTTATTIPIGGGGYEGHEKKGAMEKIKDKLPGAHDHPIASTPAVGGGGGYGGGGEVHEKKGIMDKIKEKLPGHNK